MCKQYMPSPVLLELRRISGRGWIIHNCPLILSKTYVRNDGHTTHTHYSEFVVGLKRITTTREIPWRWQELVDAGRMAAVELLSA